MKNPKKSYEAPQVRDLGTLQELTQQNFNKVGPTPDGYAKNPVVGSLVAFG